MSTGGIWGAAGDPAGEARERIARPPSDELPWSVSFAAVLGRSPTAVVCVSDVQVYSTGLTFLAEARTRGGGSLSAQRHQVFHGGGYDRDGLADEVLRFGVVLADGRTVTNLDAPSPRGGDADAAGVVLAMVGGAGGGDRIEARYWLAPLPPPGRLEFVCEWPAHGIGESRAVLDAGAVRAAAGQTVTIWPDEPARR